MPAASWSALTDFEAQFDTALAALLAPFEESPYGFTLYPQESADRLVAPRLEYQFSVGAPAGPGDDVQQRVTSGRSRRQMAYQFTLLFRFIYDRRRATDAQLAFRGALRDLLSPPLDGATDAFATAGLAYLRISGLQEERSIRGLVEGDEKAKQLDAWESTWTGVFCIREDALPD